MKQYCPLPIKRTENTCPWQNILYHCLAIKKPSSNWVRIDILSVLNQALDRSLQNHKPTLLNPSDLKLLLSKIESLLNSRIQEELALHAMESSRHQVHV